MRQRAESAHARVAGDRRARGRGRGEQVAADAEQTAGVDELRELDRTERRRRRAVRGRDRHGAVGADREVLRVRRNDDVRREHRAVRRHEAPGAVFLERARARVRGRAVRALLLEESVALDDEVERIVRLLEVALAEDPLRGDGACAETDLDARRNHRALRALQARRAERLVEQVLEVHARLLEPGRVHVREVVRDRVEVQLLRLHAGRGGIECWDHDTFPMSDVACWFASSTACIARCAAS